LTQFKQESTKEREAGKRKEGREGGKEEGREEGCSSDARGGELLR
jgi:hypothetical protein